jgi:hypothetical protein
MREINSQNEPIWNFISIVFYLKNINIFKNEIKKINKLPKSN